MGAAPDALPADVAAGLAFIKALPTSEEDAFLALFAGARFSWKSFNGQAPRIGKAECEWVSDWRDFYGVRLKNAGLFYFDEGVPKPALGMAPGSTCVEIDCGPTELGYAVREAWWADWNAAVDAQA